MEMNVLKKASVVAAVTTAGLLAVSPLAFAGGHGGHGHGKTGDKNKQTNVIDNSSSRSSSGLVNIDALNGDILGGGVLNNANVCPNVKVDAIKILGLLGGAHNAEGQSANCVSANGNTSQENDND